MIRVVVRTTGAATGHGARFDGARGLVFTGDVDASAFAFDDDPARALAIAHANLRGTAGACAVAATLGATLRIAWVGDCRAYLVRDGRGARLTRDHTLAELLAAEGLGAAGPTAEIPIHRLGLRDPPIARWEEPARAGDRLVLATPGAWRGRTEASMLEAAALPDPERAAGILVNGPAQQDASVLVMDAGGPSR